MFAVISAGLQGNFQRCRKSYCRQPQIIINFGGAPARFRNSSSLCDNERYQRTLENFGYLIQQATVFGRHVHVSCASGDDAIYYHGLSGLCRALSPFPPRLPYV